MNYLQQFNNMFGVVAEHTHSTHKEEIKCTLSFGKCWYVKGRRDKQSNRPAGAAPNDIKFT